MERLNFLLDQNEEVRNHLKRKLRHTQIAALNIRLNQVNERINKFGQRYSVILVTINYLNDKVSYCCYTDITESDAIEYTKLNLEHKGIRDFKLSSLNVPTGRLLNKPMNKDF